MLDLELDLHLLKAMSEPSNPWLPPHLRKPYSSHTTNGKYLFESPPLPNAYDVNFPLLALVPRAAVLVPWADLPPDIVRAIAQRLTVPEYLRMLLACTRWASALRQQPLLPSSPHFPFLALVRRDDPHAVRVVGLPEKRSYRLPVPKMPYYNSPLPRTSQTHCVGRRGGWLVFVHNTPTVDAHIVNPVTGDLIRLPSLRVLHKGDHLYLRPDHVVKIALSDDRSVAMLVYKHLQLAFARPGDDVWTKLYIPRDRHNQIADAAYHNSKFFVIFEKGQLRTFDLTGPFPKAKLFKRSALSDQIDDDDNDGYKYKFDNGRRWLVSTPSGDLLQVRETREKWNETKGFVIKRFDPELYSCWHDATDLMGGCSMFLDDLQGTALKVDDVQGLKGNRVYFFRWFRSGIYYDRKSVRMLDIGEGVVILGFPPEYSFEVRILYMSWFLPSLI